jgi:hypothetical protein
MIGTYTIEPAGAGRWIVSLGGGLTSTPMILAHVRIMVKHARGVGHMRRKPVEKSRKLLRRRFRDAAERLGLDLPPIRD